MLTASFPKILFWMVVVYFAVRFLARYFLPVLAKKVVEKASEELQKQQQNSNQTTNTEKPKDTKKVGDYVDFEEID